MGKKKALTNAEKQARWRERNKYQGKTMNILITLKGDDVDKYLECRDRAEYFGAAYDFAHASLVHGAKMVSNWGAGNLTARKKKKVDSAK